MSNTDFTTTKIVLHHTPGYDDSLWMYSNGYMYSSPRIDYTVDAEYWCKRLDMTARETVTADNGKRYTIWRRTGTEIELECAIPAHEVTA